MADKTVATFKDLETWLKNKGLALKVYATGDTGPGWQAELTGPDVTITTLEGSLLGAITASMRAAEMLKRTKY